jgi:hypothetical protein
MMRFSNASGHQQGFGEVIIVVSVFHHVFRVVIEFGTFTVPPEGAVLSTCSNAVPSTQ